MKPVVQVTAVQRCVTAVGRASHEGRSEGGLAGRPGRVGLGTASRGTAAVALAPARSREQVRLATCRMTNPGYVPALLHAT
eukprot:3507743-Pleurochrysis_carterae.AAC.2